MPRMSDSGVYMIESIVTGERYVGSTNQSFSRRWSEHKSKLNKRKNGCPPLQESWDKHGETAFRFVILEVTPETKNLEREQYWMDHFRSLGLSLFNRCPEAASHKGLKMPREAVERVRQTNIGRPKSDEERCKLSQALKGRPIPLKALEAIIHDWPPLVAPDGSVHKVRNLLEFCRERNLDMSAMRKVALGLKPLYKGWRRLREGERPTPYDGPIKIIGKAHTPVAPDGTEYPNVTNLEAFCREHGLESSAMRKVCKGRYSHHRGWRCCPGKAPYVSKMPTSTPRTFTSPDGSVFPGITNVKGFCRKHGLDPGAMLRVYKGLQRTHLGWICHPD